MAQKLEIDQRVAGLDTSNKELHKQLGQSRQQVAFLSQELDKLKTQLADSRQQFAQAETARSEAEQKMQAMAVSATRRGGAIITANSSRTIDLSTLDLPGLPVRQDGDVVRIEIPADRLFPRGGVQLRPEAAGILASVAAAIRKNYPENIVGIEVHGDGDPLPPNWQSEHQLTASQAMVVFDQLTRTQRMPPNQLFVTGHGSNHPIDLSNSLVGKARNRRVDIVVYPDRYE